MTAPHTADTPADHLRPGDHVRRDGREFVVDRVEISAGEAVFLVLLAANDNAGASVHVKMHAEELVRRVL